MATKNMCATKTSMTSGVAMRTSAFAMSSTSSTSFVAACWRAAMAADAAVAADVTTANLLVVDVAGVVGAGSYGPTNHGIESTFAAAAQHGLRVSARRLTSKPGVAARIDGDPRSWSPPV